MSNIFARIYIYIYLFKCPFENDVNDDKAFIISLIGAHIDKDLKARLVAPLIQLRA